MQSKLKLLPMLAFCLVAMQGAGHPVQPARVASAWCCSVPTLTGTSNTGQLRTDVNGNPMDVHDGQIDRWGSTYYLYGTTYGCGFAWQQPDSRFCGFVSYSSPDLASWTPQGPLFDASTASWQARCAAVGCFRPKVLQRPDGTYVLWTNQTSGAGGQFYDVFTSNSPTGPFAEQSAPKLYDSAIPPIPCSDGDQSLFEDSDGSAWIAYAHCAQLVVEQLTPDYLSGVGNPILLQPPNPPPPLVNGQAVGVEAPILIRRGATYFLLMSNPACPYCIGTGTAYETAASPLGPWTFQGWISQTSCGGQPDDVLALPDGVNLLQVDQWQGKVTETTAAQAWNLLEVSGSTLQPISCSTWLAVPY